MRLLLVEDHPELSHWLQKALTGAGFAVDVAPDGVAADHLLLNERYALAVLDVALPRLNGSICWRACASAGRICRCCC